MLHILLDCNNTMILGLVVCYDNYYLTYLTVICFMLYAARKSDVNEGSLCHDDNLKRDPWPWLSKYCRKCISLYFSSVFTVISQFFSGKTVDVFIPASWRRCVLCFVDMIYTCITSEAGLRESNYDFRFISNISVMSSFTIIKPR